MRLNSTQVRSPVACRWSRLLLWGVCAGAGMWLLLMAYMALSDPCQGHVHTAVICNHYKQSRVSGSLCDKLCKTQEVRLSHCLYNRHDHQVFYWKDMSLYAPMSHVSDQQDTGEVAFSRPHTGTSMEQFKEMVSTFVETKLGGKDHKTFVDKIMDTADVNSDQKVSLAEAKTIWALLQNNEFFMSLVFRDSGHVPAMKGFCGDMYALEYVPNTHLYSRDDGWLQMIFPGSYTWGFPDWKQRAKICVGLLEFTLDAYQHGSMGTFYMCKTNNENIGYNYAHDVKMLNLLHFMSKAELRGILKGKTCRTREDCQYTRHCTTLCDRKTKTCTDEIVHPNLHLVCTILNEYLLKDIPKFLKGDLQALVDRCLNLHSGSQDLQLEHSLVLLDIKSLLWKQIHTDKIS